MNRILFPKITGRHIFILFGIQIFFFSSPCTAQVDSLLHLDKIYQAEAVHDVYEYLEVKHPTEILQKLQKMEAESRKKGDKLLAWHFWSMQYQHRIGYSKGPERINIALEALETAKIKGWSVMVAEWSLRTGEIFYTDKKYGPAFDHMLRGYKLSKELGYDKYPHLARFLIGLGLFHYYFGDYAAALNFFREIFAHETTWPGSWSFINALNTAGLCHQQLNQPDSSIYYITRARDMALTVMRDTAYAVIIDGNRALALRQLGKLNEAIPPLETDFQYSPLHNNLGSGINAAIELASIYIEKKEFDKCRIYMDFAGRHLKDASTNYVQKYYDCLYLLYRHRGNLEQALVYFDSSQVLKENLDKQKDEKILIQAKQRSEIEHYQTRMARIETSNAKKIFVRNIIMILLLLTVIVVVIWYKRHLDIAKLKKQLVEEELASARKELNAFTQTIIEKNSLIASIHQEVNHVRARQTPSKGISELNSLLSRSILTEDDWQHFRKLFEKVYPGFFFRMREKFPDITQADIRLLSLAKLRLSPKDMATMLGISHESIKKSRQRLRQRIHFPEGTDLRDLADSI